MAPQTESDDQWPGVPFAYEYVRPSYEYVAHRMETIENRIRALLTIGASFIFAVPTVTKIAYSGADLRSPWFASAVGFFVLAAIGGIIAHLGTSLRIPSPATIYETMAHMDEWHFKQAALVQAGKSFKQNATLLNRKGYTADGVGLLILFEGLLLILWVVQQAM